MIDALRELLPPDDEVFAAAREGRSVIQACRACGTRRFPARLRCARCGSDEAEWVATSGRGTVHSYAVVHQKLHPAFDPRIPYVVALVDLEEGPRMMALMIDTDPAAVTVGAPVEMAYERIDDDLVIPRVRLCR